MDAFGLAQEIIGVLVKSAQRLRKVIKSFKELAPALHTLVKDVKGFEAVVRVSAKHLSVEVTRSFLAKTKELTNEIGAIENIVHYYNHRRGLAIFKGFFSNPGDKAFIEIQTRAALIVKYIQLWQNEVHLATLTALHKLDEATQKTAELIQTLNFYVSSVKESLEKERKEKDARMKVFWEKYAGQAFEISLRDLVIAWHQEAQVHAPTAAKAITSGIISAALVPNLVNFIENYDFLRNDIISVVEIDVHAEPGTRKSCSICKAQLRRISYSSDQWDLTDGKRECRICREEVDWHMRVSKLLYTKAVEFGGDFVAQYDREKATFPIDEQVSLELPPSQASPLASPATTVATMPTSAAPSPVATGATPPQGAVRFFITEHAVHVRKASLWRWSLLVDLEQKDAKHVMGPHIKSVVFHLHPTFQPSVWKDTVPPFQLERTGWGMFAVRMVIAVRSANGTTTRYEVVHQLKFISKTSPYDARPLNVQA